MVGRASGGAPERSGGDIQAPTWRAPTRPPHFSAGAGAGYPRRLDAGGFRWKTPQPLQKAGFPAAPGGAGAGAERHRPHVRGPDLDVLDPRPPCAEGHVGTRPWCALAGLGGAPKSPPSDSRPMVQNWAAEHYPQPRRVGERRWHASRGDIILHRA